MAAVVIDMHRRQPVDQPAHRVVPLPQDTIARRVAIHHHIDRIVDQSMTLPVGARRELLRSAAATVAAGEIDPLVLEGLVAWAQAELEEMARREAR